MDEETKSLTGEAGEFKPNLWLDNTIQTIETLSPNQRVEIFLPEKINPYFFISELGRKPRTYEIGGIYNQKTRSVIVTRGGTSFQANPFGREYVVFPAPRINPDGSSDDLLFHTHPPRVGSAQDCLPSVGGAEGDDLSNTLNLSIIEKWDNYRRTLVSVVASGGSISITESTGPEIDDKKLLEAGVTREQIILVKRRLGLYPSYGLENRSLSTKNGLTVFQAIKDFYENCENDKTTGYMEKYRKFEADLKNKADEYGLTQKDLEKLIKYLREHEQTRQYVGRTFLENSGFTREQASLIQSMYGLKITVYRVDEDGMTKLDTGKSGLP